MFSFQSQRKGNFKISGKKNYDDVLVVEVESKMIVNGNLLSFNFFYHLLLCGGSWIDFIYSLHGWTYY